MKAIYFDMDGTIANLYGVEGWLDSIINKDARPYVEARPLVHMATLARQLNKLQRDGYRLGIVSWLAKNSNEAYDMAVTEAKLQWLRVHLKSVRFDEIHIVAYGTPKQTVVDDPMGILFDDEENNRLGWTGTAYDIQNIVGVLKGVM